MLARDPENRLLARGPRFRVDAEVVRDTALFVSGLLVEKHGGTEREAVSSRPGLWEAVSFNNSQKYVPDTGEGQYRRSLYTYWKRQSPPPNMLLFDAPTREYCVVRRPRTNTPLQALALLNDPQFVEASRAFAQRMMTGRRQGCGAAASPTLSGWRPAASRRQGRNRRCCSRCFKQQLADYRKDKEAAEKLLDRRRVQSQAGTRSQRTGRVDDGRQHDPEPRRNVTKDDRTEGTDLWTRFEKINCSINRRHFFGRTATGIGAAALGSLLNPGLFARDGRRAEALRRHGWACRTSRRRPSA